MKKTTPGPNDLLLPGFATTVVAPPSATSNKKRQLISPWTPPPKPITVVVPDPSITRTKKTKPFSGEKLAFDDFCRQAQRLSTEFIGSVIESAITKEKARREIPVAERLERKLGGGLEALMAKAETMIKKRDSEPYESKLHTALTQNLVIVTEAQQAGTMPSTSSRVITAVNGIRAMAILIKGEINKREGHKLAHLGNCSGQIINRGNAIFFGATCEVKNSLKAIGLTNDEAVPALKRLVDAIEEKNIGKPGSGSVRPRKAPLER